MNYYINWFFGGESAGFSGQTTSMPSSNFPWGRWSRHSGESIWPSCSSVAWGWARAIWRTRAVWHLRAPPTVSENWVLYRNKRKCSRPGFRCKSEFFQGSSTFLHDTTRKNVTFQPSDASCVFVSYIALFANSDFCLAWGNRLAPWTTILHIHKASIPSPSGTPKEVVTWSASYGHKADTSHRLRSGCPSFSSIKRWCLWQWSGSYFIDFHRPSARTEVPSGTRH